MGVSFNLGKFKLSVSQSQWRFFFQTIMGPFLLDSLPVGVEWDPSRTESVNESLLLIRGGGGFRSIFVLKLYSKSEIAYIRRYLLSAQLQYYYYGIGKIPTFCSLFATGGAFWTCPQHQLRKWDGERANSVYIFTRLSFSGFPSHQVGSTISLLSTPCMSFL